MRSSPTSESVRVWHALSLHAAGRSDAAVAELMEVAADGIRTPDLLRYEAGDPRERGVPALARRGEVTAGRATSAVTVPGERR